ncbi:MAG: tRNA uridine-5-carboxymethylaminomethyl(34) synthesis enzyme MnmG [Bacillota bacterium]
MDSEIVVVGGGHAGCEAALAASRMGRETVLVTMNRNSIALMPCNPAIGGPGKAQLVRELDALGGQMAVCADRSSLQSRMLNTGKGPAVQALRVQCDKAAYSREMRSTLEAQERLGIEEDAVEGVLVKGRRVTGVMLASGRQVQCAKVVLTTGVYMESRVIAGEESRLEGPGGEKSSKELARALRSLGLGLARFKTGTSPRVLRDSVDFSLLMPQWGSDPPVAFSFMSQAILRPHLPCWLTHTNERTHRKIRDNLHRAPLFTGEIKGRGPRYCPSIEDKIVRFGDRPAHQVFLEPEGESSGEMYLLGLSTSLPVEVQEEMVRTVRGLEDAVISKPGYAIEYDCLVPTQLTHALEVEGFDGLYCAGQINGTSGYEEAAAQGLLAGINAARAVAGRPAFVLDRSEAFIGVLVDDLVSKGTAEPYRMLTSRAEYRLLLRQDNADLRLTERGFEVGLASEERVRATREKSRLIAEGKERLARRQVRSADVEALLRARDSSPVHGGILLKDLLSRPEIQIEDLIALDDSLGRLPGEVLYQLAVETKYAGYIGRQRDEVARFRRLEGRLIPPDMDYGAVEGLSYEARQKLSAIRPASVGEALRVSGVSLADVALVLAALGHCGRKDS